MVVSCKFGCCVVHGVVSCAWGVMPLVLCLVAMLFEFMFVSSDGAFYDVLWISILCEQCSDSAEATVRGVVIR